VVEVVECGGGGGVLLEVVECGGGGGVWWRSEEK
jgi:hypothetical protein